MSLSCHLHVTLIYSQLSLALNLSIHVGSHLLKTYFSRIHKNSLETHSSIHYSVLKVPLRTVGSLCKKLSLIAPLVSQPLDLLLYHKHFSCQPVFLLCLRKVGGDNENRTHDPLLARQVLSQLSYTPKLKTIAIFSMVKVLL